MTQTNAVLNTDLLPVQKDVNDRPTVLEYKNGEQLVLTPEITAKMNVAIGVQWQGIRVTKKNHVAWLIVFEELLKHAYTEQRSEAFTTHILSVFWQVKAIRDAIEQQHVG